MATNYKKRSDVPLKYKWDLSFLLEGKTIEERIDELLKITKSFIKIKDSKYESAESFLKFLKAEDKQTMLYFKIHNYLFNWTNENITSPEPNQHLEKLGFEMDKIEKEIGPETPRIFANEKKITEWMKSPKFADYRITFKNIFETKKHQLPKAIQEYRTNSSRGNIEVSTPFSILTDAELVFMDALDSKGKKHKVNHSTISKLGKSKDATLRKNASEEYKKGYMNVKETLSNFLFQHFKKITVEARLKKFNSSIEYLIFEDRSSEKLLLSLYKSVQDNVKLAKKAKNIHKKLFKAKYGTKMTKYDGMMPVVSTKVEMTTEEQKKVVLDAFKPFGSEYTDVVKRAYKDKWVDFETYPGKRTGAYSIGASYGLDKKLILMNNDNDIRSAETLAHEMGHSMHSYFSDLNNNLRDSSYKIFVAEIASIFNELMLFDHILKTSDNDKLKLQILHQMVEGFIGTVFRQVEWSNYEYDMYNAIEKGVPVSNYTAISNIYIENAKKYSTNPNKKWKPDDGYGGIRVPHYYYGFYVYKYAIGQLCANIFFNRYKTQGPDALKVYIKEFLSMGGTLKPLDLLKHNGIDLENPATYAEGFNSFSDTIKEYEKLSKKVYGKKY